jgi:hypothetical protein
MAKKKAKKLAGSVLVKANQSYKNGQLGVSLASGRTTVVDSHTFQKMCEDVRNPDDFFEVLQSEEPEAKAEKEPEKEPEPEA